MRQRVISAVIALLISVPLVLLGGIYFKFFVLVIGILGLKELLDAKGSIPVYIKYISYLLYSLFIIELVKYRFLQIMILVLQLLYVLVIKQILEMIDLLNVFLS